MRGDDYLLTSGTVARLLGLSNERVRQLDDELRPQRGPNGYRRYRLRDVQLVEKRRGMRR